MTSQEENSTSKIINIQHPGKPQYSLRVGIPFEVHYL